MGNEDSSKMQGLAEQAVLRHEQGRKLWAEADKRYRIYHDARRLLSACREYVRPGKRGITVAPGESYTVTQERLAVNETWHACNEEFCRRWMLECLVPSVPVVKQCLRLKFIREFQLSSPAHEIARDFYLRLLQAKDLEEECERMILQLAAVRIQLKESRFELHEFFGILSGQVPVYPQPRQLERAGQLYPWQKPSGKPISLLDPRRIFVEMWDGKRIRFVGEGGGLCTLEKGGRTTENTLSSARWDVLSKFVDLHGQSRKSPTAKGLETRPRADFQMTIDPKEDGKWRRRIEELNPFLVKRLNLIEEPFYRVDSKTYASRFGGFSQGNSLPHWSAQGGEVSFREEDHSPK